MPAMQRIKHRAAHDKVHLNGAIAPSALRPSEKTKKKFNSGILKPGTDRGSLSREEGASRRRSGTEVGACREGQTTRRRNW